MNSACGERKGRHGRSGWRILIAGTGGQGVLTAARLLCDSFVALGHDAVSGQLHGMAQRGGSVQSSVLIDCGISPVIASARADCVLGFEPVETARALPLMSAGTVVYVNTAPVTPYVLGQRYVLKEGNAEYPNVKQLLDNIRAVTPYVFPFDGTRRALEAGSSKTLNIIMLGCLFGSALLPFKAADFWNTAARQMPPHLKETNKRAFFTGVELGRECHLAEARP